MSPKLRFLLAPVMMCAAMLLSLSDTGCTKEQTNAVLTDLTPAGACVVNDFIKMLPNLPADPLQAVMTFVNDCAGMTVQGVINIINELLAAKNAASNPYLEKLKAMKAAGEMQLQKQ